MDIFEKLLNRTYNFLSYRPRSEKEVRDYLVKKLKSQKSNLKPEELISSIINKLKEQKFLDDFEFTKWWIEQRSRIKPKALRVIKFELKQKGIAKELIDKILDENDAELISEYDKAIFLAKKKAKRLEGEDRQKQFEKLARFLAGKGFDWETIKEVIDQVMPKEL